MFVGTASHVKTFLCSPTPSAVERLDVRGNQTGRVVSGSRVPARPSGATVMYER